LKEVAIQGEGNRRRNKSEYQYGAFYVQSPRLTAEYLLA